MKKETIDWLKKANDDIKTADFNLKGRRLDAAAFYSQQASEKALKAIQIEKLGNFRKIHDLVALAQSVNATDEIKKSCSIISPFYTIIRYPDVIEKDKQENCVRNS